jgi:hypothetical protein
MIPLPADDLAFPPGAGRRGHHDRPALTRAAGRCARLDLVTQKTRPVVRLFIRSPARDLPGQERRVSCYPAEEGGAAGVLPGEAEQVEAG